jgi:hypothetical protein
MVSIFDGVFYRTALHHNSKPHPHDMPPRFSEFRNQHSAWIHQSVTLIDTTKVASAQHELETVNAICDLEAHFTSRYLPVRQPADEILATRLATPGERWASAH